jgi:hypothetical protein
MVLFINPISETIRIFVLEIGEVVEVRHTSTIPKWNDYDEFLETINDIFLRHNIDSIWCVIWPWTFTRMRIVTLTLNTFSLVKNIELKACHFFDIVQGANPILQANDREYILLTENCPELKGPWDIESDTIYTGYATKNDFTDTKNFIEYSEDIQYITKIFQSLPRVERLAPVYLKEPHITWSKKNTFPSW